MKQVIIPISCILFIILAGCGSKKQLSALKLKQPLTFPDAGTTPILAKFPRR